MRNAGIRARRWLDERKRVRRVQLTRSRDRRRYGTFERLLKQKGKNERQHANRNGRAAEPADSQATRAHMPSLPSGVPLRYPTPHRQKIGAPSGNGRPVLLWNYVDRAYLMLRRRA